MSESESESDGRETNSRDINDFSRNITHNISPMKLCSKCFVARKRCTQTAFMLSRSMPAPNQEKITPFQPDSSRQLNSTCCVCCSAVLMALVEAGEFVLIVSVVFHKNPNINFATASPSIIYRFVLNILHWWAWATEVLQSCGEYLIITLFTTLLLRLLNINIILSEEESIDFNLSVRMAGLHSTV